MFYMESFSPQSLVLLPAIFCSILMVTRSVLYQSHIAPIISSVTHNHLQYLNGDPQCCVLQLFSPQSLTSCPAIVCSI